MTSSIIPDEIKARYSTIEREADAFGRIIGVRRLRPSEVGAVTALTSGMDGFLIVTGDDGAESKVPERSRYLLSAAVREVNGVAQPFPKTRQQLDGLVDMLDEEGFAAAVVAYSRLPSPELASAPGEPKTEIDAAKN